MIHSIDLANAKLVDRFPITIQVRLTAREIQKTR